MTMFYACESSDAWVQDIVNSVVSSLQKTIESGSPASLLVSGGSTPTPIYKALSETDIDWSKVHIALVDERWVEPDHGASNERLIRETLLVGKASAALFTGMKLKHETPNAAATELNSAYAHLPFPFDVVLLGMGSDGHTASLFPHAEGLVAALDTNAIVAPITARPSNVTGDHIHRMTLTGPAIASAKNLILALRGEEKRQVWEAAAMPRDVHDMPIRAFLGQPALNVYWTSS